ncbi:MAG: NlpC/P60 family protein [Betaproteobacteria bacterium]|nr:NlpC/P60 family protein [Betaproteobacteria bacterium]
MVRNLLYLLSIAAPVSGCSSLPLPAPVRQPTAASAPAPIPEPRPSAERAEALLQVLLALGIDYRPGGNSPATGFDCSGLVAHVFREAYGIRLPQNARAQSDAGGPVSLAQLQAGDLVFYNTLKRPFSHVGIYIGDGKFVHAPKSGAQVRVESIRAAYWRERFNGARRIEPGA